MRKESQSKNPEGFAKIILKVLRVLLIIIFLPLILLLFLLFLIIPTKSKKEEKERKAEAHKRWEKQQKNNNEKKFSVHYTEPSHPVPDEEFIQRIDEFECIQFYSFNGLSGGVRKCELVASKNPEKKECVLNFLKEHPISELLYGNRDEEGFDMDHWRIYFIFANPNLNRCITGYGWTESTYPFLSKMLSFVPEILSEEEEWRRRVEIERMKRDLNNISKNESDI